MMASLREKQTVVPVLGMHRSGTSLTTRLLNLLGLDLGADLQAAAEDNQTGFWEHRFFQMVNMRFLEGFGLNSAVLPYQDLLSVSRRCRGLQLTENMVDQISHAIEKEFSTSMTWGLRILEPFYVAILAWVFVQRLEQLSLYRLSSPDGVWILLKKRCDPQFKFGMMQTLFLQHVVGNRFHAPTARR